MSIKPDIEGISFESCCISSIETINSKLMTTKVLQMGFLPAVFASMFVSPTNLAGRGSAMTTIAAISQADWVGLTQAASVISELPRRSIQQICFSETLRHDGKLALFWRAMYESFY